MSVKYYLNNKKYKDELLLFIHDNINSNWLTDAKKVALVKEHKRLTNMKNNDFYIKTYESAMNFDKVTLEKMKILKRIISTNFNLLQKAEKHLFCFVAYYYLNINIDVICLFLSVSMVNYYKNIIRCKKHLEKDVVFRKSFDSFIYKYGLTVKNKINDKRYNSSRS